MYCCPYTYIHITFLHIYMFTSVFFSSDNDECEGTHKCVQICTNTKGSFYCECKTGFKLNSDGANCTGEYYMKHTHVHTKKQKICMYKIIHTLLTI